MAKFKFIGNDNDFHLEDDKEKTPLKNGQEVEITVKRADKANDKHGEIFKRLEKDD